MRETTLKNIFIEGAIPAQLIADGVSRHADKKNIGAHSIFLGQVREDIIEEKKVTGIFYTAYEEMALEKMNDIRKETFAKYPLTCLHVHHSVGLVKAGAICLFVFTSSAHRKAAAEACQELVERIKSELPIWGKEIFDDHSHQWKINS